jgi:hypothetical protein
MNNLASVNHLRGDLAGALRLYRSALAAFHHLFDRRYIAETYHNLPLHFGRRRTCTKRRARRRMRSAMPKRSTTSRFEH